jgi:hypothetical protein
MTQKLFIEVIRTDVFYGIPSMSMVWTSCIQCKQDGPVVSKRKSGGKLNIAVKYFQKTVRGAQSVLDLGLHVVYGTREMSVLTQYSPHQQEAQDRAQI